VTKASASADGDTVSEARVKPAVAARPAPAPAPAPAPPATKKAVVERQEVPVFDRPKPSTLGGEKEAFVLKGKMNKNKKPTLSFTR